MTSPLAGFLAPWALLAFILALHLLLPARRVVGYARDADTGEPLRYRLNGLLVALVTVGAWVALGATEVLRWDWLYLQRWWSLAGACALGLTYSFWVVLRAPTTGKPLLADLFLGRTENPQYFGHRVDAKMFLYLFGAVVLELNVLAFAAHHYLAHPGDVSPGVLLYVGLFSWFVFDYLTFEKVHLWTYDLFAERVGFKLGWGCLTFYPYGYAVGLWAVAPLPTPQTPTWLLVLSAAVFLAGWSFARGANMQKFAFKRDPQKVFLGLFEPQVITDGQRALLCSGFWGISRHVNYLGEILMATGLALALGYPGLLWPWLYPLYYVALLFPRERADDRRCAAKYGALWEEYRRKVPRRIIPGLY